MIKRKVNDNSNYTEINAKIIDKWVESGWEWGKPIDHETYIAATKGIWSVVLTPRKPVPKDWFCDLTGAAVLGLASGGGQQIPIFAACGALCTVMDISDKQLESEDLVAKREGYKVNIVKADMTEKFPFPDESFDLIFHPVSNCYIEDVYSVFKECFRVLKKGGILLSGLDNGINFLFDDEEKQMVKKLPFNPLKDEKLFRESIEKDWGIQFSHSIEEQVGGQIKAGFILADIYQDFNSIGNLHDHNVPTFYATKAIKPL
jgi:SAM-dependent methyltransferase